MKQLSKLLLIIFLFVFACFPVFAEDGITEPDTTLAITTAAPTTEAPTAAPTTQLESTTEITTVEETTEAISETTIFDESETLPATLEDLSLRLEYIQAILTIALVGGIFLIIMFLFYKVFDMFVNR